MSVVFKHLANPPRSCFDYTLTNSSPAFDLLEMIGEFYDDLEQRDAASTLQTALKRHVVTRCEDPRHTARTNTPAKARAVLPVVS